MKKNILILYTGGTIGMDYTENGLSVVPGLFDSQLKTLPQLPNVVLDLIEYEDLIDSSDIKLSGWVKIIEDICKYYDKYDGFVVIHGTDTMAFSASILSFALQGLSKPVILTGSQLPLVHKRSDGWNNLIDAIYSAMQTELNEVAIAFNHKLFRGCRAQKISTNQFIGFDSVDEEPLAKFGIDISWYKQRWLTPNLPKMNPVIPKAVKILSMSFYPGFTTDFLIDTLNHVHCDAIILQTYGSGTIPMGNTALIGAIENAISRGIILVAITQVIEGRVSNDYTNSKLENLGIVSGGDMTVEASIAKLTILFSGSMNKSEIAAAMGKNLVGELTVEV